MAKRAHRLGLNNLLFSVFWWMLQKISPKQGKTLLYWGLQSGAFPNRAVFDPVLMSSFFQHTLHTPIGIGAGFDNKANVIDDLIFMGAGFGELGPYTLEPENPTVEEFYLKKDKAVVTQSLGVQNPGVSRMIPILTNRRYLPNIIGVNITSTSYSEEENIKMGRHMTYEEEFDMMARKVAPFCDYITLDFSTAGMALSAIPTDASAFVPMIKGIKKAVSEAAPIQTPLIFVKLPLSMTPLEMSLVCQNVVAAEVDAVIVGAPASLYHMPIRLSKPMTAGMLSGRPLKTYMIEMISRVRQFTQAQVPIMACDGVFTGRDAYEMIAAGASWVQVGTVLQYEGPAAITKINRELAQILKEKGFSSVKDAVGADYR